MNTITEEKKKVPQVCQSCKRGQMYMVYDHTVLIGETGMSEFDSDPKYYYCDSCGDMKKFLIGYKH